MLTTKLYVKAQLAFEEYKSNREGVTAIEYAIIAAAIATVVGLAFTQIGSGIKTKLNEVIGAVGGTTIS
ncbi:TPA: Flp family type IVb pilin [Vibrio vulnificus]|nr:Flp family type IVb pilin [Vibrio vulnificus]HDY8012846.1 Flp family type IVb pilin [Vibrio vulnificus]